MYIFIAIDVQLYFTAFEGKKNNQLECYLWTEVQINYEESPSNNGFEKAVQAEVYYGPEKPFN